MKALLDTNILIDYLNGLEAAREEIDRYKEPFSLAPLNQPLRSARPSRPRRSDVHIPGHNATGAFGAA